MAQYLLSVLDTGSPNEDPSIGVYESAEAARAAGEAIDRFNDKLAAGGYFVFANGLSDPTTATVVDGQGETPIFTDGPYVETKEYAHRPLDHRGPRPRRRAQARGGGVQRVPAPGRGAAVPQRAARVSRQVRPMPVAPWE